MVYGADNVSGSFIRNVISWKSILMNAEERKKRPLPDGVSTKGKMTLVHIEIGENNGRNG